MSERNDDDQEISLEEWQIEAIKQGIRSADQGKFIEHSVVKECGVPRMRKNNLSAIEPLLKSGTDI